MKSARTVLLMLLLFTSSAACASASATPETAYRFGVFPYLSPSRMDSIFSPVSRELAASLQRRVKFRTSSNLQRFKKNLAADQYDFVLIPPVMYPLTVDKLGYIPLLRVREPVHAVIMVLENSPLRTIEDLRGKTIAIPPIKGPVVKLVRRYMRNKGMAPDTDVNFRSNKTVGACLQKVLVSQANACIAPNFAVAPFEKSMGVKLRTLVRTEGVPNRSLAVHPRVPESDRAKIRQTFLSLSPGLLQSMNTVGFVDVVDREYDIIRSIAREQLN